MGRDAVDLQILNFNIRKVYSKATKGNYKDFYKDINSWCYSTGKVYKLDSYHLAGVFSVLFEQSELDVEKCKELVSNYMEGGFQNNTCEIIIASQTRYDLEDNEFTPNQLNLYSSILNTHNTTRIYMDRHMAKLAPESWGAMTPKRYDLIKEAIKDFGTYYNKQELQGMIWQTLKPLHSVKEL